MNQSSGVIKNSALCGTGNPTKSISALSTHRESEEKKLPPFTPSNSRHGILIASFSFVTTLITESERASKCYLKDGNTLFLHSWPGLACFATTIDARSDLVWLLASSLGERCGAGCTHIHDLIIIRTYFSSYRNLFFRHTCTLRLCYEPKIFSKLPNKCQPNQRVVVTEYTEYTGNILF